MSQENNCLVCNSKDIVFRLKCTDHLTGGGDFDIYICDNCGFMLTIDPPAKNEIEKYYDTADYISHSDTKSGLTNILFHSTRNLMLYCKKHIVRQVTKLRSGSLLDIGCGTGYFAAFMKYGGWKVTGLEANKKARNFAREKFDLDVVDEIEITEFQNSQFDCITLWHVFEHLHDPVKSLTIIQRLLKPGGVCIAAMPNCSSSDAQYYRQYWAAWDVPRHLWHFTPDTFRRLTGKAGFELAGIRTLPLDVFYISVLSEKYKGSKMHFIRGILKAIWFSIPALFNKQRSSSLIYLLRKSS